MTINVSKIKSKHPPQWAENSVKHYSNHLNTGLVWYLNCKFVPGCQMVWYSNCGLKIGLKKACFWSKMSSIWMVRQVTWFYHLNTGHPHCLVFRWIWYSDVWYSDGYCICPSSMNCVYFNTFEMHCTSNLYAAADLSTLTTNWRFHSMT